MERVQAKGDVAEEELKALEMDVTGKVTQRYNIGFTSILLTTFKIMLASWRGARFEVVQVLRDVVDNVLHEKGASDAVLFNRAKVTPLIYCERCSSSIVLVRRPSYLLAPSSSLQNQMNLTRKGESWKGNSALSSPVLMPT